MPKLRITLYGSGNIELSDRLVEQELEYAQGPKEKHSGSIRLDVKLENKDQVEGLVNYLRMLALDLPVSAQTKKKIEKSKQSAAIMGEEPLKDLIHTIGSKFKAQEEVIEYLRGFNFVFVNHDFLMEEITPLEGQELKIKDKWKDYQFLVRMVKRAKDPAKDKYDPQMVVAIKILGDREEKFGIFLYGKFHSKVDKAWKDHKGVNFKKVEQLYSFPEVMERNERAKFRNEDRKIKLMVEAGKVWYTDIQPSNFYTRWAKYVTHAGKAIKIPKE